MSHCSATCWGSPSYSFREEGAEPLQRKVPASAKLPVCGGLLGPEKNFYKGEKILVLLQLFNMTVFQQTRSWAALVKESRKINMEYLRGK